MAQNLLLRNRELTQLFLKVFSFLSRHNFRDRKILSSFLGLIAAVFQWCTGDFLQSFVCVGRIVE
jgi:hypothetical protein